MKVGLFGFGRAGKAVATIVLQNEEVHLCWVVRKTNVLQHRSVPEFLGIKEMTKERFIPRMNLHWYSFLMNNW